VVPLGVVPGFETVAISEVVGTTKEAAEKSFCESFVSGHDFSRADRALLFFP
jgi:hypothetical protein